MTEELKPCPFCGSTPKIRKLESGIVFLCPENSNCRGSGLVTLSRNFDTNIAIKAWNHRASDPTHAALVEALPKEITR